MEPSKLCKPQVLIWAAEWGRSDKGSLGFRAGLSRVLHFACGTGLISIRLLEDLTIQCGTGFQPAKCTEFKCVPHFIGIGWKHVSQSGLGKGRCGGRLSATRPSTTAVEREHRAVTRVEEFNEPGGVVCIAPKKSRHPRFMLYRGAAEEGRKNGEGYVVSAFLVRVRALTVILRALKERASTTIGLGANLNAP